MDFTTNYCGPYWSDGKIQPSVEDGESAPVSDLDAACKRHDEAYAKARTETDLVVADEQFYQETQDLGIRGPIYGSLVLHGNRIARLSKHLFHRDPKAKMVNFVLPIVKPSWFDPKKRVHPLENATKAPADAKGKVTQDPETTTNKNDRPSASTSDIGYTGDSNYKTALAKTTIDAWAEESFEHPSAGFTSSRTVYGSVDPADRIYAFHENIKPYKPLKKKQVKFTRAQEIKAAQLFFQQHPPRTKHTKNCSTCRVLMQSPKYRQLLLLSETPSVAPKRK